MVINSVNHNFFFRMREFFDRRVLGGSNPPPPPPPPRSGRFFFFFFFTCLLVKEVGVQMGEKREKSVKVPLRSPVLGIDSGQRGKGGGGGVRTTPFGSEDPFFCIHTGKWRPSFFFNFLFAPPFQKLHTGMQFHTLSTCHTIKAIEIGTFIKFLTSILWYTLHPSIHSHTQTQRYTHTCTQTHTDKMSKYVIISPLVCSGLHNDV